MKKMLFSYNNYSYDFPFSSFPNFPLIQGSRFSWFDSFEPDWELLWHNWLKFIYKSKLQSNVCDYDIIRQQWGWNFILLFFKIKWVFLQLQGSNSIMAYLTSTTNNNNSDITYYLKTPIQIEMSKSQVYAMYPLTYVQDFNNKPMEDVISSSLIDCQDGDYDTNPTCGWQYDSNNQTILYSQGYCCECSFLSVIGLDNSQLSRGNMCEAFNIGEGFYCFIK